MTSSAATWAPIRTTQSRRTNPTVTGTSVHDGVNGTVMGTSRSTTAPRPCSSMMIPAWNTASEWWRSWLAAWVTAASITGSIEVAAALWQVSEQRYLTHQPLDDGPVGHFLRATRRARGRRQCGCIYVRRPNCLQLTHATTACTTLAPCSNNCTCATKCKPNDCGAVRVPSVFRGGR